METVVVNPKKDDPKYILNDILRKHDVVAFREFITTHKVSYSKLTADQIADDHYLSGVMHLYKAFLPYFGEESVKSFRYCQDNGIIEVKDGLGAGVQEEGTDKEPV